MIKFEQQELQVCGKIDYSNAEQYYRKGLQEIQVLVVGNDAGFGGAGALAAPDAGCAGAAVQSRTGKDAEYYSGLPSGK